MSPRALSKSKYILIEDTNAVLERFSYETLLCLHIEMF